MWELLLPTTLAVLHLVTMSLDASMQPMTPQHVMQREHVTVQHDAMAWIDTAREMLHGVCPIPQLLTRSEWALVLLILAAGWPLLCRWLQRACVDAGAMPRVTSPHRPPGPARQALLQRFTL